MLEKLIKYQEVDTKLIAIENKLNQSEEKKQAFVAYKYVTGVGELVAKLDKKAEDLMAQLNALMQKKSALSASLKEISDEIDNISSEDEAVYSVKKVEEIMSSIKALDGAVAKLSDAMNAVKAEYDQIRVKTKKAQEQYAEYSKKFNELKDGAKAEVDALNAELSALRKQIAPDMMLTYDNKRKDKIFPVLKELNGNKCGACGMELSMKSLSDLNSGKFVECDNCHKLVYKV
jgi:predicted  nucleic acid-binding Zn-ribbon protein